MIRLHSLRTRIAVLFILGGALLGTLFAVAAVLVSNDIEMRFVADTLGEELDVYVRRIQADPDASTLSPRLQGFVTPIGEVRGLPAYLQGLAPGVYERYQGDTEFHVAVEDHDGKRFYLVHDATQIEYWEGYLHRVLIGGVLLFSLLGLAIGIWFSRRIVAPVIQLADEVEDLCTESLPRLVRSQDYGDDEVGQLARAFEEHCHRINDFVRREREFTENVSHELRTPLAVMRTTVDLLQSRAGDDERLVASLGRIERAVVQMSELIDAFLLLAREPAHSQDRPASTQPLEPVLREVVETRQKELEQGGLGLQVSVHGSPEAGAPRPVLSVILNNLLGNAIAYTREGKIEVTLAEHSVTVTDTGPGIPSCEQARVFDRAFRGRQSGIAGAGLGLNIVKRLCDRYGWHVRIDSAEGQGTLVRVTFSP